MLSQLLKEINKLKMFDVLNCLSNLAFPSNEIALFKKALKSSGYVDNVADNILFYHGLATWREVLGDTDIDINAVQITVTSKLFNMISWQCRQVKA